MAAKKKKKSASTKSASKKSASKKSASKRSASKKSASKKGASKKSASKKGASKKTSTKKVARKTAAKKKGTPDKGAPKKQVERAAAPAPKTKVADVNKVAKIGPKPTTTIVQHVFIQATPEQVFDALVQPVLASTVTGGEATGDPVVGAEFTHWNGYIHGKHVELVRGERIVQEWTTTEWPKGAGPSRVEFSLVGTGGGTELTMTHSAVPSEQAEDYRQGWIDFYWTPMRAHFGG